MAKLIINRNEKYIGKDTVDVVVASNTVIEEAMLKKLLGIDVFTAIKRSEWKKIRKEHKLCFSIPNNRKGENDSIFTIREIIESTKNNKTDFMYSVILSSNEEKMLPEYIKKGLLWLTK